MLCNSYSQILDENGHTQYCSVNAGMRLVYVDLDPKANSHQAQS